jgi:hypothetical protein
MNVSHASQSSASDPARGVNGTAPLSRPSVTEVGLRVVIVRASHVEARDAANAIANAVDTAAAHRARESRRRRRGRVRIES